MSQQSFRSKLITRRTYNRPIDEAAGVFESWAQTVDRVIGHQRWLWERAKAGPLSDVETDELQELRALILERKVSVSGRTLWLGGTDVAKQREASQFNCSFTRVETVFDVVDCFWLLLQGCGVGFEPVPGILNGFSQPVDIQVIRSSRLEKGHGANRDYWTSDEGLRIWKLEIGDSAEAWAKAVGKILAMKRSVDQIILDFSQVRPGGVRLKGYGWISSGDETVSRAFEQICKIMSRRAGQLLDRIDILDIMNWLGTTLSSRRSAEICTVPFDAPEALAFMTAKKDYWKSGNDQRGQSNNSVVFYHKPSKLELKGIFQMMLEAGGSEPGFINGTEARRRAPWFKGVNPCAEILLGNKSFCNLVEVNMARFVADESALYRAVYLSARANYRQTCVDLKDGVLSESWHELNEFLRLCGVGLTGIVQWMDQQPGQDYAALLRMCRQQAQDGANGMADALGLSRPKTVTTVKPSGTLGKVMDTTEGVHRPIGKYIFNNVNFSRHDPLVPLLRDAQYQMMDNPIDKTAVIVTLPVAYEGVAFDGAGAVEVNLETALSQLDRYKLMMQHYVDHNCSVTINYSPDEIPDIINWLYQNWDSYVGVSFILRSDPTKTAEDLGYPYLPQEVVTKEAYDRYVARLQPIDLEQDSGDDMIGGDDCVAGVCPVR